MLSTLRTKDLFLSAYLLSCDICLQAVEIEEGSRVVFLFLDTGKLDELSRQYREGKALCNVARFKESMQALKDEMFTLLRREERRDAHSKGPD